MDGRIGVRGLAVEIDRFTSTKVSEECLEVWSFAVESERLLPLQKANSFQHGRRYTLRTHKPYCRRFLRDSRLCDGGQWSVIL